MAFRRTAGSGALTLVAIWQRDGPGSDVGCAYCFKRERRSSGIIRKVGNGIFAAHVVIPVDRNRL
jgi:hypothetical protein